MPQEIPESAVIDVRSIPKPQRHPLIFDALEKLAVGESLVVLNDHNPIPLRGQVEAIYHAQFEWRYLEEGPDEFRLQFTRREPAPHGFKRPESKKNRLRMAPPSIAPAKPSPVRVNLLEACRAAHSGPQWAHECDDLDMTLLSWESGRRIETHVNNEVDVVCLGVEGSGIVTVNGAAHEVRPGVLLLIPKGCERAVESTSERFTYLSVHQRRRGLMPTFKGKPLTN